MNIGLVDKLCCCFLSVQGPVDENPKIASFLQNATAALHGICQLCFAVNGRWVLWGCQLEPVGARAGCSGTHRERSSAGDSLCPPSYQQTVKSYLHQGSVPVSHLSELQTLPPLFLIPHRVLSLNISSVQSQGLQEVFYYQLKSTLNWFVSMICL